MKVLAAIATLAIAAALGAQQPQAADRTAKLDDPATSGQTQSAPNAARELDPLPASVARTGLSEVEAGDIRDSVRGHIKALGARNAGEAYRALTPEIQDFYKNSSRFMAVLTSELEPLANARAFAFSGIVREAEDAIQNVVLTGPEGREWMAQYRLQRQSDGRWAIQGCIVEPFTGQRT